jgi:hypothetical protein
VAVSVALGFAALTARAADRFVATSGADDGNDCLVASAPCRSVSHAADQAASGDTINVAGGVYRDNVRVVATTTLTFLGGWDGGFSSRDPLGTPSIVKGGRVSLPGFTGKDRVWTILAEGGETIDVSIDGFVLRNGRAGTGVPYFGWPLANGGRAGGGLTAFAYEDSAITLQVSNTVVTKNRDEYGGAGLSLWAVDDSTLDATLDNVRVVANKASYGSAGVLAFVPYYSGASAAVSLVMSNCVVTGNRVGSGGGGGVGASNLGDPGSTVDVVISASTITGNALSDPFIQPGDRAGSGGISAVTSVSSVNLSVVNSIVYGNRIRAGFTGADFYERTFPPAPSQLTVNASYSDIGDVVMQDGTFNDLGGNLAVDPVVSRVGTLAPGSPMIDSGTCVGAPPIDFEGDPRPTGAACDIGADEFVP